MDNKRVWSCLLKMLVIVLAVAVCVCLAGHITGYWKARAALSEKMAGLQALADGCRGKE